MCVRQLRLFLETYATVPLDALVYCTGEANYGGRVTDDKDRRCANAILVNFYNEAALHPGYQFQKGGEESERAFYQQPSAGSYDEYIDVLKGLPLKEQTPEVFGLHANAAITKDLKETRELFSAILLTQSRSSGGGAGSGDELLAAIASDIASKLPPDFDLEATQAVFPVEYLQSMNTVLQQELSTPSLTIACTPLPE
jgi:dynein heavy chain